MYYSHKLLSAWKEYPLLNRKSFLEKPVANFMSQVFNSGFGSDQIAVWVTYSFKIVKPK
jgi:hypothetical protein